MERVTVIGGGIAGLAAAITCVELGASARVLEARARLGGRARSSSGPFMANLGPHALYSDGPLWAWLKERRLLPPVVRPALTGMRWYANGRVRAAPPVRILRHVAAMRQPSPPADQTFRYWCASLTDESTAERLSAAAGVFAFVSDPGALSAEFVWERARRVLLRFPPVARYPVGGWNSLIARLESRARAMGVEIDTSHRVKTLPPGPVIVATDLRAARQLLGDPRLDWPGGRTVCLDLGLESRPGDPFIVSDLDHAGWVERFTACDRSLAPPGHELVQAQMPLRPAEPAGEAQARLEGVIDTAFPGWRGRTVWRRRLIMEGQTGAVDLPGTCWMDRPAVDQGGGVFRAGDAVAAPGLLAEVALYSAADAARRCVAQLRRHRPVRSQPPTA